MLEKVTYTYSFALPAVKAHRTVTAISTWLSRSVGPRAIRLMPDHRVAMGTTQGAKRQENQDRVLVASYVGADSWDSFELLAVCDGLGGMRAGAQCAAIAAAHVVMDLVRTRRIKDRRTRLERALVNASNAVFESFKEQGGTTIAAVLFDAEGGTAIAVGDTRIYSYESDGELVQITTDDTIGARVAQFQGKEVQTVQRGPFTDNLAQFIGQAVLPVPQVYDLGVTSKETDRGLGPKRRALFVTTDGIHRIPKKVFSDLIQATPTMREVVARLVTVSEWLGGHDNASMICIEQGHDKSSFKSPEAGPFLLLHDPFGEMRLSVGHAEEFSETTSVIGRVGISSADPADPADTQTRDGLQPQYRDTERELRETNVRSVDPELNVVRTEEEAPIADQAGQQVGLGPDTRQTASKSGKSKARSSKPKKGRRKKKKGKDESLQPELNIRISQEPD